jgi:TP901 family phage tail tape measure protein
MAGGNIKGITIEIGGDTTKLSSALSQADKALKNTQKQLSEVERSLKFDPGNTDLLKDKQVLLADKISETKNKLEALQKAQKELDAEGVDKNSEEYKELQVQIDTTKSKLDGLNDEMKEFGSAGAQALQVAGSKISETGDKISGVGEKLTAGVTGPIVAAGAAAGAAWTEVDAAMDTIVTKTGASGAALDDMQQRAQNIATTIPTSFQSAGDAVGELNTRFGATGDQLEQLSTQFIEFATINNQDVSGSIDTVQAAMAAYGLSADQAGLMLDTLNKAGQDTGVDVLKLASDMTTNSEALQEMGFNASDSAMFLANLDKSGVDSSVALTGLKAALKNATADGKTTGEAMQELSDKIKGSKDKTEAMQAAVEVFGAKAGPVLGAAIYDGKINLDALGTSMSDFSGNTADAFNATLDPADQFTTALNNLKAIGAQLFTTIQTMIAPVLDKVVQKLKDLNARFQEMTPEQQQMIIKIAAIAAAIGPVLVLVGKAVSTIGAITAGIGKLSGALSAASGATGAASGATGALSGSMLAAAAPILAIVAVVAVLVAAFKHLWDTNEGFRNAMTAIWTQIKGIFTGFVDEVKERFASLGISMTDITNTLSAIWNGFCNLLAPVFEGVFQQIANVFQAVTDVIVGILDIFIGIFTGNWDQAWQGVQEVFGAIWDFIKNTFQNVLNIMEGILNTVCGWFGTTWSETWNNIKNVIVTVLTAIQSFFVTIWNAIVAVVTTVWNAIKNAITVTINAIATVITTVWNTIQTATSTVWNGIKTAVSTVVNGIRDTVSSVFNAVKNTVTTVWNGIKSAIITPIETARDKVKEAIDTMKGFFNFSWKLPDIKLPHFSIEGEFSLNPPSVPHFAVDWYDRGGIFSSPTVIGVGEKRPEFVGALDDLRAIVREESAGASSAALNQIVELLTQIAGNPRGITVNQTINAEDTSYVGQQKQAAKELGRIARALT